VIRARRGPQIAAVAAARKILVLTWHLLIEDKDSAFLRPSLFARKYRTLELALGRPAQFGNKRSIAHEYNLETVRQREIDLCLQAERAYAERTPLIAAAVTTGRGCRQGEGDS